MRWENYVNPDEVRKAISTLQAPGHVFEIRILGGSNRKDVLSGYFRDPETLLQKFDTVDLRGKNVYITLGDLKEECFSRSQCEHFEKNVATTSDPEVNRYRWLFVDLDPDRMANISSSDAELQQAKDLAIKVEKYMQGLGFAEPVKALSGNGVHLLYRIDLPATLENTTLIEKCLKVLADLFNNGKVKVDTTNYNPSRICKLHGTLAQKGTNSKERPHRMSKITSIPEPIGITDKAIVEKLAGELPDEPAPTRSTRSRNAQQASGEFDLLGFMSQHGMAYTEKMGDRSKIYELAECPFNHSHRNGDAKIFLYSNGAISFKCHHNSCSQYRWQDVRLLFEPDAYDHENDDSRIDEGYRKHKALQEEENAMREALREHEPESKKPKPEKKEPRKLKGADNLLAKDIPEPRVYIGVGNEVPLLVEGTCILSAKPKLGKSWLSLAICISVANGEDFLGYKTRQCSTLYLDLETSESLQQKRLRKMLKGNDPPKNFYLDTETPTLEGGFVEQIEAYLEEDPSIGIVVVDVFQIIRSPSKNMKETEYEHAYRDITPLNELAQKHHISIILVCHDRKSVDPDDPFSNILGSTGLQGAATQMMVMYRRRRNDPVHISVKGKTIDGLPELDVKLENAEWSVVEGGSSAEQEKRERLEEYLNSDIRRAVLKLVEVAGSWKGRCSALIDASIEHDLPITDTPKTVGGFLNRHRGLFLLNDRIKITVIDNGSGGKIYRIEQSTVDTVDENKGTTVDGFVDADKYGVSEIPFP